MYCSSQEDEMETMHNETVGAAAEKAESVYSECSEPFEVLSLREIKEK